MCRHHIKKRPASKMKRAKFLAAQAYRVLDFSTDWKDGKLELIDFCKGW
ncbi:MAG: hypothetical protein ABI415_08095 [Flavitalea sp.]